MAASQTSTSARRAFSYDPRGGRFSRLFTVKITHTFYTRSGGLCRDFAVTPTPSTVKVLERFGLLLKDEGDGFSVLARPNRIPDLIAWLRSEAIVKDGQPQYWSRLTFLLTLKNPEFIGVTALPIGTTAAQQNLYGSNRTAHPPEAAEEGEGDLPAILPPGRFMGGEALRPVTGAALSLDLPSDAAKVTVTDIAGEVVIPTISDQPVVIFGPPSQPKQATLDFSDLPYDLYTVHVTDTAGDPVASSFYPHEFLYVSGDPIPMALLDVLFTQPTPDAAGVYPIPSLFEGGPQPGSLEPVAYRLPFDARHTYWDYYVVLQGPGRLGKLSIADAPGAPPSGATFRRDPKPAPLPNGSVAVKFSADRALPLRQNSSVRLQLTGQWHDKAGDHPIQLTPLGVAPAAPVWPGPDQHDPVSGTSEMFVSV